MQIAYANGIGFETASLGELTQALKVAKPSHIVFDSPVKTRKEIRLAMASGVHLNVDNLTELERVSEAVQSPGGNKPRETDTNSGGALHTQYIGVRINPQVGAGSIATHSTSTSTSKFGVPLLDMRDDLIAAYRTHTWLNAIHVHVGSQGVAGHLAVAGIKAVVDFAIVINRQTNGQIKCVDIGGGLSVNFGSDAITPTFQDYADLLRQEIPQLFDDTFSRVLTEFGRSLTAKAGWFGSRIEYTKNSGGRHIAAQHCGADLCIRTIYHPEIWTLRVSVLDSEGFPVDESQPNRTSVCTDVAGPCCIAGDIIAHERQLPQLHAGDFVVVHDVGGYYMASYSRYNCRQAPPVIGYNYTTDCDVQIDFEVLQKGETVEQSLDMFNRY
ncbi:hypothetical protein SARC_02478 [Sphaeroforma arctica JP610]|uniref:Orn/DAP/Arg decarboxylase 2 N-terminal domain-containing protein n=1 Tax=Sphaeroforma arctica JP610 TaxID=667725 RepID=A0A0L0G8X4_9EUKA|nr:hypothetical protein SARC_02478 [Sphaeroforma arctica JP610]KNC85331.1 hypothetical protein SARC_02478 [Sphaeroforma arctica JP610]|eukprot:XP_014159233.1 hypothetical protein SARC_02478 [Sphaeroforma arctica JP610]